MLSPVWASERRSAVGLGSLRLTVLFRRVLRGRGVWGDALSVRLLEPPTRPGTSLKRNLGASLGS